MSHLKLTSSLIACFAIVGVGTLATSAYGNLIAGNIYVDTVYASGGAAGSGGHTINIDPNNDIITLDVYAVIAETTGSASLATDKFTGMNANFATFATSSGTALRGDISWGNWHTSGTNPVATTAGASHGIQMNTWTPQGSLGLGGTGYSTDNNVATHWWAPTMATPTVTSTIFVDANGAVTTQANAVGVEWLLGQIQVNFDTYKSGGWGSSSGSLGASLNIGIKQGKSGSFPYAFQSSTQTSASTKNKT